MSSRRSVCRGCGAEIVWVKTTAGKSMPCNPGAVPFWARPGAPGKVVTLLGKVVSCDFIGERDRLRVCVPFQHLPEGKGIQAEVTMVWG